MTHYTGWIGGPEIIIILIVVLLLFGGKKIPELARGLGKGIKDFKKATDDNGLKDDLKDVASEINSLKTDIDKINPKKVLKSDKVSKSTKQG